MSTKEEIKELKEFIQNHDSDIYDKEDALFDLSNGNFTKDDMEDYNKENIIRTSILNGQRAQALRQCKQYGFETCMFGLAEPM